MTNTPETKNPVGRPTKYRPEYCDEVMKAGIQGKSKTWMAGSVGVVPETLDEWANAFPEFSVALKAALIKSQLWWEDAGQSGMYQGTGFNGNIWSRSMAARFPADWRETNRTEQTGAGGGPVRVLHEQALDALK